MISRVIIVVGIVAVVLLIIGALYGSYFSGFNAVQSKDENVKRLAADVDAQ